MGLVNIGGVLGAFAGPYIVGAMRTVSGSFAAGLVVMGLSLAVAAACVHFATRSNYRVAPHSGSTLPGRS
jgi:ACS family tartrate transporter-like MFS transporter